VEEFVAYIYQLRANTTYIVTIVGFTIFTEFGVLINLFLRKRKTKLEMMRSDIKI